MSLFKNTIVHKCWTEHKGQLFYFVRRVKREDIQMIAGYLSFVCLMSLVPLIMVTFSVMTAFPLFSEIQQLLEQFVYQHFVPAAGDIVKEYLTGFINNASKMSAIAISFLFVAALLLISTIDNTFNKIWRIKRKRRLMTSFAMYWMVLTLGPILVGASIALSTHILSIVAIDDSAMLGRDLLLPLLPLLSSIAAFVILYMAVPNKVVPFRFALLGATVAGVLFEIAKISFAKYLSAFPSYQIIYGALATIPIIFLWVYVSWLVVLVGALITVSRQEYIELTESALKEMEAEDKGITKESVSIVDDSVMSNDKNSQTSK
ncbi:virulence factor BrkB family protein [Colwellia sp. E2M01]|uniref:virulence factor BrkB family protein n=1 Tax=Colwellia sp. E2M01 TaxID=2841561 RepID=UPI00209127FB|nr:virulence factor BrkB family protein [Colwellia sp. E2M01]